MLKLYAIIFVYLDGQYKTHLIENVLDRKYI